MSNFSDKSFTENQNTFYFQIFFFKNRAVYEIMWKNLIEAEKQKMTTIKYCACAVHAE